MFPVLKLVGTHVKPAAMHFAQAYVAATDLELSCRKTHGLATITAATALVKHQRTMICPQLVDQCIGFVGRSYSSYSHNINLEHKERQRTGAAVPPGFS